MNVQQLMAQLREYPPGARVILHAVEEGYVEAERSCEVAITTNKRRTGPMDGEYVHTTYKPDEIAIFIDGD